MTAYQSVKLTDNFVGYIWQGRGNNANSYIFTGLLGESRPHVLIDPGHINNEMGEPCFVHLTQAMARDKIRVEEIGLIINTHSHPDHSEANQFVIQQSGAVVTLSREEDDFSLGAGEKFYSMYGASPPQFSPLFYLKEGILKLGDKNQVSLQVLISPGHSPGSVCLYWQEMKTLITGDVVFYGSIGRTDFPTGSLFQLKKSIERLTALDVACLAPGHSTEYGAVIRGKELVARNFQAISLFF